MSQPTRLVADLPDLKLEILHRPDPEAGLDHLYLHLALPPALLASPFAAWAALGQAAAQSWLGLAQAATRPWASAWASLLPPSPPGRD
ncbi:MAG: hypothetical protein RLZZ501_2541 [Pseudomonadota bacterium]|jgi:hypothetical protein